MVSFDVISLFTKIPVSEALDLISKLIDPETLNLIKIFLSSTFFTFKGVCYEQTKGTTMGSSLSPVVANIFMEHFES
jgi:retron-type reverse transcriptase